MAPLTRRSAANIELSQELPLQNNGFDESDPDRSAPSTNGFLDTLQGGEMELDGDDGELVNDFIVDEDSFSDGYDSAISDPEGSTTTPSMVISAPSEVEQFAQTFDQFTLSRRKKRRLSDNEAVYNLSHDYGKAVQTMVSSLEKIHAKELEAEVSQQWTAAMNQLDKPGTDFIDPPHSGLSQLSIQGTYAQKSTVADLKRWKEEAQTWQLLRIILARGRTEDIDGGDAPKKPPPVLHPYSPEQDIWTKYFDDDPEARVQSAVLEWLKTNADVSGKDMDLLQDYISRQANEGDFARSSGWLDTSLELKKQKRLHSWPQAINPKSARVGSFLRTSDKAASLVTQLDPDAPTRQSNSLEKGDRIFERFMWFSCWEMVRRGKSIDFIRDYFSERGEEWRAAIVRGNQSSAGEHISSPQSLSLGFVASRDIWRQTCLSAARNMEVGSDVFERAILGASSGDFRSMEPACRTWDDLLFAHYNSLLLNGLDRFVHSKPQLRRSNLSRRANDAEWLTMYGSDPSRHVMKQLEPLIQHLKPATKLLKSLQGALISNSFLALACQYGTSIGNVAEESNHIVYRFDDAPNSLRSWPLYSPDDIRGLRMMTHILLIQQDLNPQLLESLIDSDRQKTDNILLTYMQYLRNSHAYDLLPLYAARLGRGKAEDALGKLLPFFMPSALRRRQIKLIEKMELNSLDVVNGLVVDITNRSSQGRDIDYVTESGILHYATDSPPTENSLFSDASSDMPKKTIPRINLEKHAIEDEPLMALVHGFEWYLSIRQEQLDDLTETMQTGTSLYVRFLGEGQIYALIQLQRLVPSSAVWNAKAPRLLRVPTTNGTSTSNSQMEASIHSVKKIVLKEKMRLYDEFDNLASTLSLFSGWNALLKDIPPKSAKNTELEREWRDAMTSTIVSTEACIQPMFKGYLTKTQYGHLPEALAHIRRAYLPDLMIAYISLLYWTSHRLSRSHLLTALSVIQTIGEDDKATCDLLDVFVKAKRVAELVDLGALISKAMLKAGAMSGAARKGLSWKIEDRSSLDVWTVKIRTEN
ncbi:MAG: Nucleoporin nup84 [Vezdaea aestivalis]|nr:MAG: Nucleoporin nup84 [Vezdaea aestivalis]